MEQSRRSPQVSLRPRGVTERIPLTAGQMLLWKGLASGGPRLNRCPTAIRCSGFLDVDLLSTAVQAVVHRHESLRTRLVTVAGIPEQRVTEPRDYRLDVVDVSGVRACTPEQAARQAADELMRENVDLSTGPLFTARLFRLSPTDHVLFCSLDHIMGDAGSLAILDREIWTLYRQGSRGEPLRLPALQAQFGDFALWQQETFESWQAAHEPYWKQRLGSAGPVRVPCGAGIAAVPGATGAGLQFSFGRALSDQLRKTAALWDIKLPFIVCAIYVAVMLRWCSQREGILAFITSRRYSPELRAMIGYIAGSLILRVEINDGDSFASLTRRLSSDYSATRSHDDFDRLPQRSQGYEAQYTDLLFNWLPGTAGDGYVPDDLIQRPGDELRLLPFFYREMVPWGFLPMFSDVAGEVSVYVNFAPEVVSSGIVERFAMNLRAFAEQLASDPLARIGAYR